MRKLLKAILLAIGISVIIAIPVFAYNYRASYTITENASTTYTMLPVKVASKNSFMASNGFMNSNALDTRVETLSGVAKPHMVTDNEVFVAIPVSANSQTNLYFTTGSSNLSNLNIITGYGGTVNVTDAAGIEFGNNFTFSKTAWYDATAGLNKYILNKPGAIVSTLSGGNITVTIPATLNTTLQQSVSANGTQQTVPVTFGAATAWQAVLTNDADTTYIATNDTFSGNATFNISLNSTYNGTIAYVRVYFISKAFVWSGVGGRECETIIRTHSTNYIGSQETLGAAYATFNTTYSTNPNTSQPWTWQDVSNMEIGIGFFGGVGTQLRCTQVYAEVNFSNPSVLTATGISTTNQTIVIKADSTNLSIQRNGTTLNTTPLYGATVPDNANDLQIVASNTTPYSSNITLSKGGTQVLWYSPNDMVHGTVLPNRASTSNNATINFGANPVGVNVTIGSMVSTGQPTIGEVADAPNQDVMPPIPVSNPNTQPQGSLQLNPFHALVVIMTGGGTGHRLSENQAWRFFGLLFVLVATIWVAIKTKGNFMFTGIACGVAIGAVVALTIWPTWSLLFAIVTVVAGFLAQIELGTNRSQ